MTTLLAAVRSSRREEASTPRTAIGTVRAALDPRSPASAALPRAAGAAGPKVAAPAADTAPGGTAAGRVGRSVPPTGRWLGTVAAAGVCLVSTACVALRPSAAWPETLTLSASAGRDDRHGWDRETVGVHLTWRLRPMMPASPLAVLLPPATAANPITNQP